MKNQIVSIVLGLGLTLSACGKDEDKTAPDKEGSDKEAKETPATKVDVPVTKTPDTAPAPAPTPVKTVALKIDTWGIELDVPEDWKGEQLNDNAYTMKIASVKAGTLTMVPTFSLIKRPTASKLSLEEAAKCSDGKLTDSKDVGEGRLYYVCEMEVAGNTMFALEWVMPLKDGGLRCSASGPDISAMHKACESIRES